MSRIHTPLGTVGSMFAVITMILIFSTVAVAQTTTTTGAVVSASPNTVTVMSTGGQYQLFIFSRDTRKPATLPVGTQVRVVSTPGNEPSVRVANEITLVQGPEAARPPEEVANVPSGTKELERDIERELRRYQIGVRAGVALDPELVLVGVQGQIGPFFRSGVFFRPALDFGLGEVTAMFSLNGDVIYRLPFSSGQDRWSSYIGAGVGVNFVSQSFEGEEDGARIDFDEFESDTALNILAGVRRRGGMFLELKTSIYSDPSPTLRLTVGYTF
jgi:hypothetical protein